MNWQAAGTSTSIRAPRGLGALPEVNEFILSIDLGAGSLRAGALRPDGSLFAAATAPLAIDEPQPGWAEIDPEKWWAALLAAGGRVLRKVPRSGTILGVCLTGLTRAQVLLDREGKVLGPAMQFRDHRAEAEAREVARHLPADNPAEAITPFHPLARLAWVARRQPAVFAELATVLEPKDFLNYRLTGLAGATASPIRGSTRWSPCRAACRPGSSAAWTCCAPGCTHPGSAWARSYAWTRPSTGWKVYRSSPAPWIAGRRPSARARYGRARPTTSPGRPRSWAC